MEMWFSEFHTPDVKHSIRVNRQLYSKQSDYQRIDIFETPEFGRVLTLDGNVMLTERDEFIYDEMITHVPMAVHKEARDILVIGADTVVAYENQILGKPKDEEDARRMLLMLSGKTHSVYTGVTFVFIDKDGRTGEHCFYEKTDVSMHTLTEEEIDRYISSGDPMDKAGSYGIQGRFAIHIKGIHGDYNNVVGLPVARLYQELRKLGVDV
jgi:MAF protein